MKVWTHVPYVQKWDSYLNQLCIKVFVVFADAEEDRGRIYGKGTLSKITLWRIAYVDPCMQYHDDTWNKNKLLTHKNSLPLFHLKVGISFLRENMFHDIIHAISYTVRQNRGGSRNFERGVHKILRSRITIFRLWPLLNLLLVPPFESLSSIQEYNLVLDTRMKQYLLFWLKTKCLKCYTMYNILLSNRLLSSMHVTWANFSTEKIKWHIFLDFCCCCNANLYSKMADKLSKGSNSSTFKNVSVDIGVIGMQGKATETRNTVILTTTKTKQTNKQKHEKQQPKKKTKQKKTTTTKKTLSKHIRKKKKNGSTLIRPKCIWKTL